MMKRFIWIPLIFLISAVLVFTAIYLYWLHFGDLRVSDSVEKWGQFGDYIGGVLNPGLSFISIILVCFTLYVTSRQSMIQSFESILFELIRYHKEHRDNIKVAYEEETFTGVEALSWYITEVKFNFLNIIDDELPVQSRIRSSIDLIYAEDAFFSNTGHYFRNIYHIFKHIDEAGFLSSKEKLKYAKLVRAQLSSIESGALMLNGLSTLGSKSMVYIQRYSLLQGFTLSGTFKSELHDSGVLNLYQDEAFGDK
ncbi:putative phage abortive infection protein [Cronobacter malonaticus]|uniref:putative phage abortive infection protein n=1 Tax=Cronobacter malonaticus TaxID=413503 RepID=UPI000CFB1F3A|nr:putative phage abortive infection protein [Cronobacter malonaticus]